MVVLKYNLINPTGTLEEKKIKRGLREGVVRVTTAMLDEVVSC